MRRILNSFLQFMERDHSESLFFAATNNLDVLDKALFRRFDDVIEYSLPADEEIIEILERKLNNKEIDINLIDSIVSQRYSAYKKVD